MPYSVAARNDHHRNAAAIALQDAGLDRALAVDVASRLAGKVAKALAMELREARNHRLPPEARLALRAGPLGAYVTVGDLPEDVIVLRRDRP